MTGDASSNGRVGPVPGVGAPGAGSSQPAHVAPPPRALPGSGDTKRHTLVVLVLDKPGVLNRVASLMRARNFNIDALAVSRTDRPGLSRMTITLHGDDVAVEQAAKQLYRLVDVLKVQDVTADQVVEHELAFIKVRATEATRREVVSVAESHRARVVDIADGSVILEATGTEAELDQLVALLRSYGIKELVRTGAVVMTRGATSIEESSGRSLAGASSPDRGPAGAASRSAEDRSRAPVEGAGSTEGGRT